MQKGKRNGADIQNSDNAPFINKAIEFGQKALKGSDAGAFS